jgi:hypothetical protein
VTLSWFVVAVEVVAQVLVDVTHSSPDVEASKISSVRVIGHFKLEIEPLTSPYVT